MIAELSFDQQRLLEQVRQEWLDRLIAPAPADSDKLRQGLLWLCNLARVSPAETVVVRGPLEAQAAFLEFASRARVRAAPERSLERSLVGKVWSPAVRQISAAVSSDVNERVGAQLSLSFGSLREQLQAAFLGNLLNTSLGAGVALDAFTGAFLDFFSSRACCGWPAGKVGERFCKAACGAVFSMGIS